MANFDTLNTLYKDLISESSTDSNIKFFPFEPEDIVKYKKLTEISVLRPINDLTNFHLGDYVKTEWGRVFKIESEQIYANLEDWPLLSTLSVKQIEEYAKRDCQYKEVKLVKVVKKEVHRFFYDFEFDETQNTRIIPISVGIINESGDTLYLINKDYDWSLANSWLKLNVYPYIKDAPDYVKVSLDTMKSKILEFINPGPAKNTKLYGYYSAYDHVCLSQLFGTMSQLPANMPMYTNDLKQLLDYFNETPKSLNILQSESEHNALSDAKFNLELFKAIKEKYSPKFI